MPHDERAGMGRIVHEHGLAFLVVVQIVDIHGMAVLVLQDVTWLPPSRSLSFPNPYP